MIINRHNYEEFFLLYVDNELDVQDRAAVEDFVRQNPDLAEEMEMLEQATLHDENVLFGSKELLYKQAEGISLANYAEYFLLSVDNELSDGENQEVEKFVLKHPELQHEYLLLQQARLEPEQIQLPGKEKLYRKHPGKPKVIFINWMRISAAASIIGIAATTWFFTHRQSLSTGNPVADVHAPVKPAPESGKPSVHVGTEQPVVTEHEKATSQDLATPKTTVERTHARRSEKHDVALETKRNDQPKSIEAQQKVKVQPEVFPSKVDITDQAIASTPAANKNNLPSVHEKVEIPTFTNQHDDESVTSIAKHAVYREIDNQEAEEENTFYLGSAEINKNKLKGLFKKAVNLFEKKGNKSDGEKTLRIAGFEIKSK